IRISVASHSSIVCKQTTHFAMLLPWKVVDMSPNTVLPHWVRPVNLQLHTPSPDLIARLSNHSTAPSGAVFRRTTTKITIHAMATSKRQPPTNMATRPWIQSYDFTWSSGEDFRGHSQAIPSLREPH